MNRSVPQGFDIGPMQTPGIIGEVTEEIHRFLLEGWDTSQGATPRLEEDLSFVPKDREQVIYVYMYRAVENTALKNPKRFKPLPFSAATLHGEEDPEAIYYQWPPLHLELYYLITCHAKFRSEAERLLGWVMMRLHHATHLLYRPRRFQLPDGRSVDSSGQEWAPENEGEDVAMEKVSLALMDDLTVGDAINFFTIHEAPYRPYVTYRAMCNMHGPVVSSGSGTTVQMDPLERMESVKRDRPGGRMGRMPTRPTNRKVPFGPPGRGVSPVKGNNDDNEG